MPTVSDHDSWHATQEVREPDSKVRRSPLLHRASPISIKVAGSVAAALSMAIAVMVFGVGARDDPYITFWEAEQLAKSATIVNINGAHLEQSTSLLHVVILAILYFVTRLPMPALAYFVGLGGLAITIFLAARLARIIDASSAVASACVVAVAYPLVYWSTGELETDVAAATIVWFVLCSYSLLTESDLRRRTLANYLVSVALAITVRPDTMLAVVGVSFSCVLLAGLDQLLQRRNLQWLPSVSLRRCLLAFGAVIAEVLVLAVFREAVFHSVLPQPDVAKLGGLSWLSTGLSYLYDSFPPWLWLIIVATAAMGFVWSFRRRLLAGYLAAFMFLAGALVILFSRGDWMGGARLLVPYLVPVLVLMVVGVRSLGVVPRRAGLAILVVGECILLALFANGATWLSPEFTGLTENTAAVGGADFGSPFGASWTSWGGTASRLPWYSSWDFISTRDSVFVEAATSRVRQLISEEPPGQKITIASNQAGFIFYTWANEFPGRITFIDTQSITTNDFSRCSGLQSSFAGNLMTIAHWAMVAGKCAPPLPDLFFSLNAPYQSPGVTNNYHVISSIGITYWRHGLGKDIKLYGAEFLAQRDGWSP